MHHGPDKGKQRATPGPADHSFETSALKAQCWWGTQFKDNTNYKEGSILLTIAHFGFNINHATSDRSLEFTIYLSTVQFQKQAEFDKTECGLSKYSQIVGRS